jgi:hypothetical protein
MLGLGWKYLRNPDDFTDHCGESSACPLEARRRRRIEDACGLKRKSLRLRHRQPTQAPRKDR